ncbi:DUF262 domain-containing protein [Agromyces atrinae]|uniref:DUF262 domain-containing protein n=1 Tax=Agromyces atrinae TaxID=592376 RepID=UPI001F58F1EE|nr:DUF262 domain-containing protein [Agromyces atrinae]MCI2957116.1 DUF262 domain-containing protein [Agromyces atrinae]
MNDEASSQLASADPMNWTLTEEETEDLEHAESQVAAVSYSGQDFDVEGLVRRLNKGDIIVPSFGLDDVTVETAGFQRGFVWNRKQMDRFIESLLLGFPIPGLFLVRQQSDKRYLVLDGQQRLGTLRAFYKGLHDGKLFELANVAPEFIGLTYETLSDAQRRILDNAFLQATVVSTDGTQGSLEAVYQIFERLNSGGTQLTPHEIRVALFAGPFIAELERINRTQFWRELYGRKNPRLRDQELILRIIALYMDAESYTRPLKTFLNDFAGDHRNLADSDLLTATRLFEDAAERLQEGPGPVALRKASSQVNAAQTEAIFVALMRRLSKREISLDEVTEACATLSNNDEFSLATGRSTADELVVQARLRIATQVFEEI